MNPASRLYLLGGSPCSGKTSIADALAARHGLTAYHCDEHWQRHVQEARPVTQPTLRRLGGMSFGDVFLRPQREMIRDNLAALREEFPLVLRDLMELSGPAIAEGMAFLPELVARLEPRPPAVWVVPAPAFQREHHARRQWAAGLAGTTGDPERAFENWMRRDETAARYVRLTARARALPVLTVDGKHDLQHSLRWVESTLGLA
ncbi:MAG TPA: hypothetical protein VNT60_00465 [Deinococcales bacterium]|nr:hypothetical protein [Deinococcales bacterium]